MKKKNREKIYLSLIMAFFGFILISGLVFSVEINPEWISSSDKDLVFEINLESRFENSITEIEVEADSFNIKSADINDWETEITDKNSDGVKETLKLTSGSLEPEEDMNLFLTATTPQKKGDFEWNIYLKNSTGTIKSYHREVSMDKEPPKGEINFPEGNSYISGTVEIVGTVKDSHSGQRDSFGNYRFLLDGINIHGPIEEKKENGTLYNNWETPQFKDGNHKLVLIVFDRAGNGGLMEEINLTIDNSKPEVKSFKSSPKSIESDETTTLKLKAEIKDQISGLNKSSVKVNNKSMNFIGNNSFMLKENISTNKNEILTLKAKDKVGNCIKDKLVVDASKPINITLKPETTWLKPEGNLEVTFEYIEFNLENEKISIIDSSTGKTVKEVKIEPEDSKIGEKIVSQSLNIEIPEEIEEGNYSLELYLEDSKGRKAEKTEKEIIKIDRTAPEIKEVSHSNEQVVEGEVKFKADIKDEKSEVKSVSFSLGEKEIESFFQDNNYVAEINTTKIPDGLHNLLIEAKDLAGNKIRKEISIIVDNKAPVIKDLSITPDPTNSKVKLDFIAQDKSTDIIGAEVFYLHSGKNYELEASDGNFNENKEKIESILGNFSGKNGLKALKVRAKDSKGHWSDLKTVEFKLERNLSSEIDIIVPELVECVQGKETTFEIKVENKGEIDSIDLSLNLSSNLESVIDPEKTNIESKDTEVFVGKIRPEEDKKLGFYTYELSASSINSFEISNLDVKILPDNETEKEIENKFENLSSSLKSKREKFNVLKSEGLSGNISNKTKDSFEKVSTLLREANESLGKGDYIETNKILENATQNLFRLKDYIGKGEEKVEEIKRGRKALFILLAILAVIGAVIIYLLVPPREGYREEKGYMHRPEGEHPITIKSREIAHKITRKLGKIPGKEEEEKDEEGWRGFKNK